MPRAEWRKKIEKSRSGFIVVVYVFFLLKCLFEYNGTFQQITNVFLFNFLISQIASEHRFMASRLTFISSHYIRVVDRTLVFRILA